MSLVVETQKHTNGKDFFSPLGPMFVASRSDRLVGVYFRDQRDCPTYSELSSSAVCDKAADWLSDYFQGTQRSIDFTLDISRGTELQQTVWNALLEIPFGATCSYAQVARAIGRPSAVRAVANAIGKNPLGIIVPCHRVIGSNGSLTGYAGGLPKKAWLLEHESMQARTNTRFPNFLEEI